MNKKLFTLLMSIIFALSLASFAAVNVNAQVETIYSKYTTSEPDLDGSIHSSEWADAMCYENVGDDEKFTLFLMHGDEYIYIGIKIKDNTHNVDDWVAIFFDEGDDGGHGSGSGDGVLTDEQEDYKCITGGELFIDGYWDAGGPNFRFQGYGVSVDFEADIDYHLNRWEVEFKIPYVGDDGHPRDPSDLNIDISDTPRMAIELGEWEVGFTSYPEGADPLDASTYVELKFDNEPPTISGISYAPTTPTPDDNVTVSASVTDDISGLKSVTLQYSLDGGATWSSVTMTKIIIDAGVEKYEADIPKQASGTTVQFKVSAEDNVSFSAESAATSYTVKTLIFGMEPLLFYGLMIGLVVVLLIVVVVIVLVRGPKPPAAPPPAPPAPPAAPPAVPAATYCSKCGAPVKPGDVYCPKCGQKLS